MNFLIDSGTQISAIMCNINQVVWIVSTVSEANQELEARINPPLVRHHSNPELHKAATKAEVTRSWHPNMVPTLKPRNKRRYNVKPYRKPEIHHTSFGLRQCMETGITILRTLAKCSDQQTVW